MQKIIASVKEWFFSRKEEEANEYMPGVEGILSGKLRGSNWMIPSILFLLLVTTILWLWFSEVDIVSPAQATLLPNSRIKVIQSKEVNVVEEIMVKEGDWVKGNEALVKFASKDIGLTLDSLKDRVKVLKVKRLGWESLKIFLITGRRDYFNKEARKSFLRGDVDVKYEKAIFDSKVNTIKAEEAYFSNRGLGLKQEIKKAKLEIGKLKGSFIYQEKKVANGRVLYESKTISGSEYDELKEGWREVKNNLEIREEELVQNEIAYNGLLKEKENKKQERILEGSRELGGINEQIKQLENDLRIQEEARRGKVLYAPIAGRVEEVTVHTIRGVVQSGEVLMKVVPDKSLLEAKAKVLNQDIGFISLGQKVNVKIDSFSFTKYGYIEGKVIKIAGTAEDDEQFGKVFGVIIELERNSLRVEGRDIELKPGMTAVVDIKIGKRRLADYIISPLLRYKDEALRER